MKSAALFRGYNEEQFDELIDKKIQDVEWFEIEANKTSIGENNGILDKQNKKCNNGISLVVTSIVISIFLLVINIMFRTLSEG